MGIASSKPRKDPESSSNTPTTLTIRNITVNPLELVLIERFEGAPRQAGGFTHFFHFNATSSSSTHPAADQEPTQREEINDVHVGPFETKPTSHAGPGGEGANGAVLRLTFETPLITTGPVNNDSPHRYVVDISASAHDDAVHTLKHKTQELTSPTGGPLRLTAVYVASARHLTLYGSSASASAAASPASPSLAAWMAELPGSLPLSALSIPGTHNSPTCYVALPSVRCQAVGVRAQLDNGVRFLDVRVSVSSREPKYDDGDGDGEGEERDYEGDGLALVHSAFPVSLTGTKWFADVLVNEMYAFLDENPSETILLSMKREGTGRGTDQHLSRHLFHRYCHPNRNRNNGSGSGSGGGKHAGRWFTEPRIPTLGEARGKIVLIRRFRNDEALLGGQHGGRGWGIDASAWPDNCADGTVGSGLIRVQDYYEVGQSQNIDKKIDLARCHLEKACQQAFPSITTTTVRGTDADDGAGPAEPPPPLFINFLTASNFFNASCWPERVAARVNPSIIEYLCLKHAEEGQGPAQLDIGDAGTGIVVTDWVGLEDDWDLIRCIVGWNARLQLKN